MQVLEVESVRNNKISVFLLNIENYREKINELRKIMDYFKYKMVEFATVDHEEESFREFNGTNLAQLLNESKIPYLPISIPDRTKNYFNNVVMEKEKQIKEFLDDYESLNNKNCTKGIYLKSRIDLYLEQRKENTSFFNLIIKPQYIAETILKEIAKSKKDEINIIHFGMENTFSEIMKILKEFNINIDIFYLHYLGH